MNHDMRNRLVKVELGAILACHLAMIFLGLLALMGFTVVGQGAWGDELTKPTEIIIFSPAGLLLCACILGLPVPILVLGSLALHRFVVEPLVAQVETSEDSGS